MPAPYAYLRKSVIRRDQRTISPETQEREVRELAHRFGDNGIRLVILADWDVSGRRQSKSKRTGYLQLIEAIKSGEATAVYSYSLSRLSRSVSDLSDLFDLCRDRKVPIRLVADNLDTSTASGMLTAHILAGMAQFESDVASERVLDMYEQKRAKGEEIRTSRRYGERKVRADGSVVGDTEDGSAVLAAFDEAGTYSGAARLLNERGIKPRIASTWWASSVAVVVQRERPALAKRPPSRGVDASGAAFRLARLLRCPTCGRILTGSNLKEKGGGRRTRYACRNADSMPHPKVAITESIILPAIQAAVDALEPPGDRVRYAEQAVADRAELDAERERTTLLFTKGKIDESTFDRLSADIDGRAARVADAAEVADIPRMDWGWPPADINRLLRLLIDYVELDAGMHPAAIRFRGAFAEWQRDLPR